ncbi:phosphatase PAP2 family protein [Adlercreutzia equolifaciens]|uniref:phosphatase PAP2 family protein n=1 Tax=Adlercreutzia equolifaciens TaxID=446660 RepID=UPI0026708BD3|nr:phosphatase PAP2 family protein [Adlercreutzia equolifaciens]
MTVTNQARCEQHYEQRYEQWAAPLRGRPGVVRALNIVNHGIVVVFYAAYALLLGWACVSDPWKLAPLVGVTAVGFAAVSFFRRRFNAPRPYECCAIAPLIARDGAGKSFPSRHAFSAFAIAASWFAASAPVAVVLLVAAVVLAVCRVLGGVHFPRDVVAGAFIGSATGALAAFLAALL